VIPGRIGTIMQIKLIEGNEAKALLYRPWNGVQYGPDQSENIVKQFAKTTFDRNSGAYIMSKKEYTFWTQYFLDLTADEKAIREANLCYHPLDVEEALQRELSIVGDDPRLHHAARQNALKALIEKYPARSRSLKNRDLVQYATSHLRFNRDTDADIIDYLQQQIRYGLTKTAAIKKVMRTGMEVESAADAEREETLSKMRKEGWL
jgi:hypothetical protein